MQEIAQQENGVSEQSARARRPNIDRETTEHRRGRRESHSATTTLSSDHHSSLEGDPGLTWGSSRNFNGLWKFDVEALGKCLDEKNVQKGIHYWSQDFRSIFQKYSQKISFLEILSFILFDNVESDKYPKFWEIMSIIMENRFLV